MNAQTYTLQSGKMSYKGFSFDLLSSSFMEVNGWLLPSRVYAMTGKSANSDTLKGDMIQMAEILDIVCFEMAHLLFMMKKGQEVTLCWRLAIKLLLEQLCWTRFAVAVFWRGLFFLPRLKVSLRRRLF